MRIHNKYMLQFKNLHKILVDQSYSYEQFQKQFLNCSLTQQTYLNLFLINAASNIEKANDFPRYFNLLVHTPKFKSADPNAVDYRQKQSVLSYACQKSTSLVVQTLLNYPQIIVESDLLFYALRHFLPTESTAILTALLDHDPNLIHAEKQNSHTLLLQAIALNHLQGVQILLKRGINPNAKILSNGNTPLHQSVRLCKNIQVTKQIIIILLTYKADSSITNDDELNAYQYAQVHRCQLTQVLLPRLDLTKICSTTFIRSQRSSFLDMQQSDRISQCVSPSYLNMIPQFISQNQLDNYEPTRPLTALYTPTNILNVINMNDSISNLQYVDGLGNNNPQCISQSYDSVNDCFFDEPIIPQVQQSMFSFPNTQLLHEQILQYTNECQYRYQTAVLQIQPFLAKMSELVGPFGLVLEIVGSFSSGLWFQTSDIDVALLPSVNHYIDFQRTLQRIYRQLQRKRREWDIQSISLIRNKIKSIRLEMNDKYNRRRMDISIFHRQNNSSKYSSFVINTMQYYPQIKAMFYVLKGLSVGFGMHDPKIGGVKTYTWFLMIQNIIREYYMGNLGEILLKIVTHYGFHFEYSYQEGLEDNIMEYGRVKISNQLQIMRLNIEDPLNNKNNAGGKHIKTKQLQSMFRALYYGMHINHQGPLLQNLFLISSIFSQ